MREYLPMDVMFHHDVVDGADTARILGRLGEPINKRDTIEDSIFEFASFAWAVKRYANARLALPETGLGKPGASGGTPLLVKAKTKKTKRKESTMQASQAQVGTTAVVKFLQLSADLIVRPHVAIGALLGDPRRVGFGFLGPLILAAVYFIGISIALAMNAAHLPRFLVLNIPAEQYYSCERFFILPVGLAGTILTSGVIRLVARWWNGRGHFEDLFALLGFSLIVVAVVVGVPDLVIGILVGIGLLAPLGWEFVGPHVWLGTLWYLLLTILAVKEVEHLSWARTIVLALMGFVVNGAVQFIFMR